MTFQGSLFLTLLHECHESISHLFRGLAQSSCSNKRKGFTTVFFFLIKLFISRTQLKHNDGFTSPSTGESCCALPTSVPLLLSPKLGTHFRKSLWVPHGQPKDRVTVPSRYRREDRKRPYPVYRKLPLLISGTNSSQHLSLGSRLGSLLQDVPPFLPRFRQVRLPRRYSVSSSPVSSFLCRPNPVRHWNLNSSTFVNVQLEP